MRVLEDTNTERVSSWLQVRLEATTVVLVIHMLLGTIHHQNMKQQCTAKDTHM